MKVFITGLTGTLGTALAKLHKERGDEVLGCGRSEARAVEWLRVNPGLAELYVGDAAQLAVDYSELRRWLGFGGSKNVRKGVDRLYHCAALKHVDLCEREPQEAIKQNVDLTATVIRYCRSCMIDDSNLVFASSDKAFRAEGVYGATKLLAEKIVLQHGGAVVRLGNLIGSSGSVFQHWAAAIKAGKRIQLTDPKMTRYFLPVHEAAQFMADCAMPGQVSIPSSMKAVNMGLLALAIAGDKYDIIGSRPGETQHQWLSERFCSKDAPRWDILNLLKEAGIR